MSSVEATFRLVTQRSALIGVTTALWAGSMTSLPWALNFVGLCLSIVIASYAVVFSILLRTVLSGKSNKSRRRIALDRWVFVRLFLAYPAYRFLLAMINVGLALYYFDACFPGTLFAPHEVAVNSTMYLWFVLEHLSSKVLQLAGSKTGLPEAWRAPLQISTSSQAAAFAFVGMNLSAITPIAHLAYTWVSTLAGSLWHGGSVEEDTAVGIADLDRRERQRIRPLSHKIEQIEQMPAAYSPFPGLLVLSLLALVLGGVGYLVLSGQVSLSSLLSGAGWLLAACMVAVLAYFFGAALAAATSVPEDNVP